MEKLELLSPAKDYISAISAINSGADAIYIGASDFGARKNASNSIENIEKIINYAHLFNVKVYVTLNTILDDDELIKCQKLIQKLYEIKTDAIIIQDFGILELSLENKLPPIPIHISTQADNRDLEKIKFFQNIGIKRVILARELSLEKIQKIKKNVDIELEYFVHGALCVSYSGQCYFSAFRGKRSANRGDCAQVCRQKFSLVDKNNKIIANNQYLLSLKDNNLSNHIDKLAKAGIKSFKIEGRLKDANYVKNVTLFYHNLLKNYPRTSHGYVISDFSPMLEKSFNRGFCDDYLFNKKDNIYNFTSPKSIGQYIGEVISSNEKCFVIKTKEKLNPQDGLCFVQNNDLSGFLVNQSQKTKEGYKIFSNKNINIINGTKIYRNCDVEFEKTLNNTKTARKLDVFFEIYEDKIVLYDEFKNKIEYVLDDFEIANDKEKMKENYKISLSKTNDTPYMTQKVIFKNKENLPFLPVSKLNEIRRNMLDQLNLKKLSRYKVKSFKPIDIAKFPLGKGNYKLNVHNKKAKEFLSYCGCDVVQGSFESLDDKEKKEIELMRTKHCLKRAFLGCEKVISDKELFLVDSEKRKYPLKFDCKNCEMVVLSD